MARKAFAFRFECDITLDEIVSQLNGAGPWKWQARESYWYGDYLNCRPTKGARIRIHDHGQPQPPHFQQQSRPDYTMQVDIDGEPDKEASRFAATAKELLVKIGARNILEIEPYDSKLWQPRYP